MLFPTKDEIIDAVSDCSNLLPHSLSGYKCTMGRYGPLYYPGGFCVVFKLFKQSSVLALRVWYAEVENIRDRIKSLYDFFLTNKYSFIASFDFYEKGLRVPTRNGNVFLDIMTMDWVEGVDIKKYVKNTLTSNLPMDEKKWLLYSEAVKLVDVFSEMHKAKISHGDLQHTNIIILSNGDPVLIDYDSMYYPGTIYKKHITSGYDEYQHPARKQSKEANEKTDYFSELIICLSLLAYEEDPSIWDRYAIDNLDFSMLFTKDDFIDIESSPLFRELFLKSETLQILCNILKNYLRVKNIDYIQQPFVSYEGALSIFRRYGNFCIECGKEFHSIVDVFCTNCGNKRV